MIERPRDASIDDAINTSEIILKTPSLVPVTNSRNAQSVQRFNTGGSGLVPKLDFKQLKKVQEFKDWYAYACKLEDSVKFLRDRTRNLEKDLDTLNDKYRKEVAQREQLFVSNDQLNKALRRANLKITEIKEKFHSNIAKKCYYCNNELDINSQLLTFNNTIDGALLLPGDMSRSFINSAQKQNPS